MLCYCSSTYLLLLCYCSATPATPTAVTAVVLLCFGPYQQFVEDVGGSTLDEVSEITAAVSTVMGRLDTDSEQGIGFDEFMCVGSVFLISILYVFVFFPFFVVCFLLVFCLCLFLAPLIFLLYVRYER